MEKTTESFITHQFQMYFVLLPIVDQTFLSCYFLTVLQQLNQIIVENTFIEKKNNFYDKTMSE